MGGRAANRTLYFGDVKREAANQERLSPVVIPADSQSEHKLRLHDWHQNKKNFVGNVVNNSVPYIKKYVINNCERKVMQREKVKIPSRNIKVLEGLHVSL